VRDVGLWISDEGLGIRDEGLGMGTWDWEIPFTSPLINGEIPSVPPCMLKFSYNILKLNL